MGPWRRADLVHVKRAARSIYSALPFDLAVRLARGKPHWAFYIRDRQRRLTIDDYLDSFRIAIDTSSDIERRMLSRTYEPDIIEVVERFVPAGGICLDVGANVGACTLAMADRVGSTGTVHAIEPGRAFLARLRGNLELNPSIAARVTIHEVGLSDHEGSSQWQSSVSDPGTASMHWVDPKRPVQTIAVTTLDRLAEDQNLSRLDFLKIDVDGMDHLVIRGGVNAILQHQPVIVFETTLCDSEQVAAAEEATRWLEGNGYRIHHITGNVIRPTRFPDLSMNTLALPRGVSARGVPTRIAPQSA